jgi:hypothetical protein
MCWNAEVTKVGKFYCLEGFEPEKELFVNKKVLCAQPTVIVLWAEHTACNILVT